MSPKLHGKQLLRPPYPVSTIPLTPHFIVLVVIDMFVIPSLPHFINHQPPPLFEGLNNRPSSSSPTLKANDLSALRSFAFGTRKLIICRYDPMDDVLRDIMIDQGIVLT